MACGVPEALAPELFAYDRDDHRFVARQPKNAHEIDRMVGVMITSELGCIRYGGADPQIAKRLAQQGEGALCDIAAPKVSRVHRDHVAVVSVS